MLKQIISIAIITSTIFASPMYVGHYKAVGGEVEGCYGNKTAINTIDGDGYVVNGRYKEGKDYAVIIYTNGTKTTKDDTVISVVEVR